VAEFCPIAGILSTAGNQHTQKTMAAFTPLANSDAPTRDVLEPLFTLAQNDIDGDANLDMACRQLLVELEPGRLTNLKIAVISDDKSCLAHLFRGGQLAHPTLDAHKARAFALLDMLASWGLPDFVDTRGEIAGATSTEAILQILFAYFARPEQSYPHPAVSVFDGDMHVRSPASQRYEIVSQSIGSGGFGSVFKCKRADDNSPSPLLFAMKKVEMLSAAEYEAQKGPFDAARFQAFMNREVENQAAVSHPYVVSYVSSFFVEPSNGTPFMNNPAEFAGSAWFIIMELCGPDGAQGRGEGGGGAGAGGGGGGGAGGGGGGGDVAEDPIIVWGELFNVLSQLSDADKKVAMAQVGRALVYLHQCNILHRDVKPENIYVIKRASGAVCAKLLDFGLSKRIGATPSKQGYSNVGTPQYKAPEITGRDVYTSLIDSYAYGMTCAMVFGLAYPVRNSYKAIDFRMVEDRVPRIDDPTKYTRVVREDQSYWTRVFRRVGFPLQDLCLKCCHANVLHRLSQINAVRHPFWADLAMTDAEIEESQKRADVVIARLSARFGGDSPSVMPKMDSIEEEDEEQCAEENKWEGGEEYNMGVDEDEADASGGEGGGGGAMDV